MERFLVFTARRLLYHSTLGSRVIEKKKGEQPVDDVARLLVPHQNHLPAFHLIQSVHGQIRLIGCECGQIRFIRFECG